MQKIKKGDEVIVITGKDRGKNGKVLSLLPVRVKGLIKNHKVKVEGIQMVKKTHKPNPQQGKTGGIVEKESWIDISNVAILNSASQKKDKIKIKVTFKEGVDGKKTCERVRHFKSNDELVDIT
jgi:large subunit ribosomal protein L24